MDDRTKKIILQNGHRDGAILEISKGLTTVIVPYFEDNPAAAPCGPDDLKPPTSYEWLDKHLKYQTYYASSDWDEGRVIFRPWPS